ncbi:MAG TPA: hypothetical protein PKC87_06340, partial [Candidatus Absconditabacterales bacterium]|nr:hypothetical protein [Candidatus Absconditabacterales bacterium]
DNENSTHNIVVYREGIDNAENDYEPDQFNLYSISGAEIHTPYISNIIIIDGMTPGIFTGISINTGTLFKNGIDIGQSGTGGNGDEFEIILTSSDTYNTKVNSIINIGGVTGSFDIITRLDSGIYNSYQVYIDPTYTGINGTENGTIDRPFNSWMDITGFQSNVDYLQKKGTTYTSSSQIFLSAKNNITIGTYGSGTRPLFSYLGGGYAIRIELSNNITVEGLEINGNTGAHSLIGLNNHSTINPQGLYFFNNKIDNCVLYNAHNSNNAGFGIHASYNDGLKILNTTIYNVAVDGIYARYTPNLEIGYSTIYDVNRRYFESGHQDQIYSNGDGIQLDGYWNGFHLHHTIIDRTNGAANKFNVILASAGVSIDATGIIEYNTFITDSMVTTALHIEHGNGIITRYNT